MSSNPPKAELWSDTPTRLKASAALTTILALVFAFLAFNTLASRASAINDAKASVEQLVVLQNVRADLVRADALATNSFLTGGLEPAASRSDYLASIARASEGLTEAAKSNPQDVAPLASVNKALASYTGLIESARANNRQGYPIGAAYLKQASAKMRSDMLPALSDLSSRDQTRVEASYTRSRGNVFFPFGTAILVLLALAQYYLAVTTRRVFNKPSVLATSLLLVSILLAGGLFSYTSIKVNSVRTNSYKSIVALSQARVEAYNAKSNESLTLIARGSGETYERAWLDATGRAVTELNRLPSSQSEVLQNTLNKWLLVHHNIRKYDDQGDWDTAVKGATTFSSTAAPKTGSSNVEFDVFSNALKTSIDGNLSILSDALTPPARLLTWLSYAALLLALVASGLFWSGFNTRIKEYR